MTILPEPPASLGDPRELLLGYLDYYRAVILRKLGGLTDTQLRTSTVPSGWTPIELLKHVAYVERRWIRWGFQGEDVSEPWGDQGPSGSWSAPESITELAAFLEEQAAYTRALVAETDLDTVARVGGRFDASEPVPTLGWILFHLLQEYARHAGQLDVVRELADGATGE